MYQKVTFFAFVVVFLSIPIFAKSQANYVLGRKYSKALVYKTDRQSFNGRNLVLNSTSLSFIDEETSQPVSIPLDEIQYVKAKTGTYAAEGALGFGGFILLIALASYAEAESAPNTYVSNPEMIIYLTAGGVLVGLAGGAMFSKERIIYRKNQNAYLTFNFGNDYSYSKKGNISITFHIPF